MSRLYQPVEVLPQAVSFNMLDMRSASLSFMRAMVKIGCTVATDPEQATLVRHQDSVVVDCAMCDWSLDVVILQKALQ